MTFRTAGPIHNRGGGTWGAQGAFAPPDLPGEEAKPVPWKDHTVNIYRHIIGKNNVIGVNR